MRYIYIHGLNSGPQSRSGTALEQLLGQRVARAHNDYSLPFQECIDSLKKFVVGSAGNEKVCLMGTSLGGFYALQLRLPQIAKVAAWNPVVFPALQLARFIGENERFTDGQKWILSRDVVLSYAAAADARVWNNFAWGDAQASPQPERRIYLGDRDELIDHDVTAAFWAGHVQTQIISSGHRIENFDQASAFLK